MRMTTIVALLSLVLILSGCGPVGSQNSLFTNKDVTFDPGLIGAWVSHDDGVVAFKRLHGQIYKGVYRDTPDGEPIALEARLGDVDGLRFLDVTFLSEKAHGIHMFFRYWRDANVLQLTGLDSDWVEKMLTSGTAKLDYQRVENEFVLTAPTDDLRQFIVRYASEKEAFPNVVQFQRQ
jgi:hypothetical protein